MATKHNHPTRNNTATPAAAPAPLVASAAPAAAVRVAPLASRAACTAARAQWLASCALAGTLPQAVGVKPGMRPNDCRPGSLRHAIVAAITAAPTVGAALASLVYGPAGSKHASTPYRVRPVDLHFAATNGYITLV